MLRTDMNGSDENKENVELVRGEKQLKHPKAGLCPPPTISRIMSIFILTIKNFNSFHLSRLHPSFAFFKSVNTTHFFLPFIFLPHPSVC